MVLDIQGGPNWFKNWCVAPVIVDAEKDEVYFTPLYYVMSHFSKFMRPGAQKIGCTMGPSDLVSTAVQNPDGTIAVAIFNPTAKKQNLELNLRGKTKHISISAKALQTVIIKS
jgi:glucosylceramidase